MMTHSFAGGVVGAGRAPARDDGRQAAELGPDPTAPNPDPAQAQP